MKKSAGIPAAILGGISGTLIPPLGGVYGAMLGYRRGEHGKMLKKLTETEKEDKKKVEKKASLDNKYLEKIANVLSKEAGIGAVGKALIRTKLAPAMSKMTTGQASNLHNMTRAAAGSKVAPRVYSTPEYAQHNSAMGALGKKLMPTTGGMDANQTNKVMAVATRARRMGLIPSKA